MDLAISYHRNIYLKNGKERECLQEVIYVELKIESLKKNYGKVEALKNVTLSMSSGIYGLLGPNGAGKSTMIQIITGNLRATGGQVYYNGKNIMNHQKAYKKDLGYVPQRQGMYDTFTARKFLEYLAVLKDLDRKLIGEQVEYVLKIVGLWEVRDRKLGGFSGGMKQRILIAQALLGDPKIIILDEPTAGLDPKERIKIRNFISRIAEDKIILVATHVVSDVESIAKEIILLGGGEIQRQGTPYSLCKDLDGSVFECEMTAQDGIEELEKQFVISNLQEMTDGKIRVRLIGEEEKIRQWMKTNPVHAVFPNLQEVYLSVFEKAGE